MPPRDEVVSFESFRKRGEARDFRKVPGARLGRTAELLLAAARLLSPPPLRSAANAALMSADTASQQKTSASKPGISTTIAKWGQTTTKTTTVWKAIPVVEQMRLLLRGAVRAKCDGHPATDCAGPDPSRPQADLRRDGNVPTPR
jgi:hypothetical protein